MRLLLQREGSAPTGTYGTLTMDRGPGPQTFYTMEPPEVGAAHPAIPAGTYRVGLVFSQRFHRVLPLVIDVPGRQGIEIHPGNTDTDTEGCILLGLQRLSDQMVGTSQLAVNTFVPVVAAALHQGEPVWLQVAEPSAT